MYSGAVCQWCEMCSVQFVRSVQYALFSLCVKCPVCNWTIGCNMQSAVLTAEQPSIGINGGGGFRGVLFSTLLQRVL